MGYIFNPTHLGLNATPKWDTSHEKTSFCLMPSVWVQSSIPLSSNRQHAYRKLTSLIWALWVHVTYLFTKAPQSHVIRLNGWYNLVIDLRHQVSLKPLLLYVCLIWFFTFQSTIFHLGWVFLGWTSTRQGIMCLAQWDNTVTPMRL